MFSNKRWWFDKVLAEERGLLVECVDLDTVMRSWLARIPLHEAATPVSLRVYEEFCQSSESLLTLSRDFPRALLQRFIDVCWSVQKQPCHELYSRNDDMWNALGGPMFRCDMLVDTTCDEQCDWQRLVEEPYNFDAKQAMTYDELFVRDVAENSPEDAVVVAKLLYGLDTMRLLDSHLQRLQTFQLKGLRQNLKLDTNLTAISPRMLPPAVPRHPLTESRHKLD